MIWQKIAITISLLFWLLFAAIQTGDNARDAKNAKVVDEWLEEQVSRYENENSIPLKCPHCYLGWGFFENYETDESLIYCLWGEEYSNESSLRKDWRSKIDLLRNWKSDLASAERFDHSDRVRLEALLEWPTDSKRKLEDSMKQTWIEGGLNDRLIEARRRNKFKAYNSRCFETFNKRESLDGFLNIMGDRHAYYTSVEENRNFERDEVHKQRMLAAAENADKSPEQIELEKLNKKVEELIRKTKK